METVAIVGGGIGGLASAILLSKKGFHVTIFDKARSPQPVGAGFLLQPPGQAVLEKLGVLDEVLKHAVPIAGLQSKTHSGRTLLDLQYSRLNGAPRNGLGVQRSTIYDALLNEALRSKQVQFDWDSTVEGCQNEENAVSISVQGARHSFDLCVLSSGANSHLADALFKGRIKRPYGWGCLWTTIELPHTLAHDILHQRCKGSEKMMGILPVRKTGDKFEAALYWSMKSKDINSFDSNAFPDLKNEIMQFWPEAAQAGETLNFEDFISANYNDIWTPKPFNKKIVCIGDISHATSLQLGQGCTMALLDAWSLALHLEKGEENLTASLQQWWHSRRLQLAYVRHLSKFLTPLFQSENKACEYFRDWIMAPAGRLPLLNKVQLKTLASDVFLRSEELNIKTQ